jgi:hypothetical protein
MGIQTFDEILPSLLGVTFVNADGVTIKVVAGNSLQRLRCDGLIATNTDTIAHVARLYLNLAAVNYLLGSVSIPAGAGTLGAPGIDLIAGALPAAVSTIVLGPGQFLTLSMEVAVVATFTVAVAALGGQL